MIRKCIDMSIIAASFLLVSMPGAYAADGAQAAMADYNSGHYPTALTQFLALQKQYPNNAMVHYYTGLCRQAMGQIAEAKAEYQWVTTHDQGKLKQYATAGLANLGKAGSRNDNAAAAAAAADAADTKKGSAGSKGDAKAGADDADAPDPNTNPSVQKAIDAAKKAGVRIGKDGKPVPMKTADAAPAADKGAAGGAATKVAAKPKVRKVIQFYNSNDRSAILFEDTFNSVQKQFSDTQFQRVNIDDASNPLAAKFKVDGQATIYLGEGDKVLDTTQGMPPLGDSFADKIKTLNSAR